MQSSQRGILAVLFDLGDTIMAEETEVKDSDGVTQRADLVAGAAPALRALKERGLRLGLVADTCIGTYKNVLGQHGLYDLFDTFAISEELGCTKPDKRLFEKALGDLGVAAGERHRVIMVGNNLARDIAGARRAGLFSVWCRWNDRYPGRPATLEEEPDRTIRALPELLPTIDMIERALSVGGGRFDADLARRYAPEIRFDEREPFEPALVGCTVIEEPLPSPSFPRILRPPAEGRIIEYAVYWDWDIGHHYELEHLWVHAQADGTVSCFEASWHGGLHRLWPLPPDGPGQEATHDAACAASLPPFARSAPLIAYSQPGKHAFAPDPSWFQPQERFTRPCAEQAGNAGLLVTPLYRGILRKTAERDTLASAYLRRRAFAPTFRFTRSFRLSAAPLVSWQELDGAIPRRIDAWMAALAAGQEKPDGLRPPA